MSLPNNPFDIKCHPCRINSAVVPAYSYFYAFPNQLVLNTVSSLTKQFNIPKIEGILEKSTYLKEATDLFTRGLITDLEYKIALAGIIMKSGFEFQIAAERFFSEIATKRYVGQKRLKIIKQHGNCAVY
jgi:hypothetical protein